MDAIGVCVVRARSEPVRGNATFGGLLAPPRAHAHILIPFATTTTSPFLRSLRCRLQDPLIPIGCAATFCCLTAGLYAFKSGQVRARACGEGGAWVLACLADLVRGP